MLKLGERFGVTFQAISKIVKGQRRQKQGGTIMLGDLRYCPSERDISSGKFIGKNSAIRLLDGIEHNGMPGND